MLSGAHTVPKNSVIDCCLQPSPAWAYSIRPLSKSAFVQKLHVQCVVNEWSKQSYSTSISHQTEPLGPATARKRHDRRYRIKSKIENQQSLRRHGHTSTVHFPCHIQTHIQCIANRYAIVAGFSKHQGAIKRAQVYSCTHHANHFSGR